MSRKLNIYYSAVCGALGGLLAWFLIGLFGLDAITDLFTRALWQGGLVGLLIGAFVGVVEGVLSRARRKALLGFCGGALLGLVGGVIGLPIGEAAFTALGGGWLGRALGWAMLGVLVGISQGMVTRSRRLINYGLIGGALGGVIGGALFESLTQQALEATSFSRALGLIVLGASIGLLIALVEEALASARLRVLTGRLEGREFNITKAVTLLGRDDQNDVGLFGDPTIAGRAAELRQERGQFVLRSLNPAMPLLVNEQPLVSPRPLQNADRIQIGTTRLVFRRK